MDMSGAVLDPGDLSTTIETLAQRRDRAVGKDPPLVHDEYPRGQVLGLGQVMGGHDDGGVIVDPGQDEIVQARLRDRVQSGRRFVQDQDLG